MTIAPYVTISFSCRYPDQTLLKVLHINTYDVKGGAARAAYRLHRALRCLGHDSLMFVGRKYSNDRKVVFFRPPMDLMTRLRRRLRREQIARNFANYKKSRPPGLERFSDDRSEHDQELLAQLPSCDIINLHWVGGYQTNRAFSHFLDYQTLFSRVSELAPIVWTLHDMNAFTGGCHYDGGCAKYREGCGACPQLGSSDTRDLSSQIWQRKRVIFNKILPDQLHIVALNRWMAEEVQGSPLLQKFPITIIANGLDIDDFKPRDRHFARELLGLPKQARIVLFASQYLETKRKGFSFLTQALSSLDHLSNVLLVSFGSGKAATDLNIPHIHLGYIDNDRWISLVYSAADVFVIPSLQDNLPNTVLESMACGTPVVGFDVGGIPDMVDDGVSGYLARARDVNALRAGILELLANNEKRSRMSEKCRQIAVEKYALEIQVKSYIELYESIVN